MTTLSQLATTDAAKEAIINENFSAVSYAGAFGPRAEAHDGLTWAYYGGRIWSGGAWVDINDSTEVLTASTTTYFELDLEAGTLHFTASAFTDGRVPLFILVTDGSSVTSETDCRTIYRDELNDLSFSATVTPDLDDGNILVLGQITSNLTINAPTNASKGMELTIVLEMEGTTLRTVTWNSTYKFAAGTVDTPALSEKTVARFIYDGADWLEVGNMLWR